MLADVPNHCLKHDILGNWTLLIGSPVNSSNRHDANCGHHEPDDPKRSWLALRENFTHIKTLDVVLNENYTARTVNASGNWTMVFDTGYEIDIHGIKFFSFFDYQSTDSNLTNFTTNCSATIVGWYHHFEPDFMGCFRAIKTSGNSTNQSTFEQKVS